MSSGLPTMPKRGAFSKRMRRSFSPSSPVISACSGALKPAVAGTSWTWPSVTMMAPAMREGGTSRKAPSSAPNSRVSVRSSAALAAPASTTRTSNCLKRASRSLQAGDRLVGLLGAVADVLALAAVDDQRDDALQRIALLVEQHRIDQRQRKRGEGGEPQQRAALARTTGRPAPASAIGTSDGGEQWPGQQRFEGERPVHAHCPSRSSSAGTCTWSDL